MGLARESGATEDSALVGEAFDEDADGAVFVGLNHKRFAEGDDLGGLETDAHLGVGRHAA